MGKMIETSSQNPFGEEEHCEKIYVRVIAEFDPDRGVTPLSFFWENGRRNHVYGPRVRERCASVSRG